MSPAPPVITPVHIQRAKAALHEAGIPAAVGNQALDLATALLALMQPELVFGQFGLSDGRLK